MGRTLNGDVLIDDAGNFNEQVWLENAIAIVELLSDLKDEEGEQDE